MTAGYDPQVGDYVIWERPNGDFEEGWVYFKCDKEPHKKGFRENPRYLTIETGVKPKPYCEYSKNDPHKMIHTLLLCYETHWHQLKYIKNRRDNDNNVSTYKSQEHRDSDLY